MFGFFIFNAIRRVTSEQTAGQVANFTMKRIPRNRLTYRLTDAASYWLNDETSFQNCQHCFGFVIKAKDPYIHDECEAPFREDCERDERQEQEEAEWREQERQARQDEAEWEAFKAQETAYCVEQQLLAEEEWQAVEAALEADELDDICERCGFKSCPGLCDTCGECIGCVCTGMESRRPLYDVNPSEGTLRPLDCLTEN